MFVDLLYLTLFIPIHHKRMINKPLKMLVDIFKIILEFKVGKSYKCQNVEHNAEMTRVEC